MLGSSPVEDSVSQARQSSSLTKPVSLEPFGQKALPLLQHTSVGIAEATGLPGAWEAEGIARSTRLGAWSDSLRGRRLSVGISLPRR